MEEKERKAQRNESRAQTWRKKMRREVTDRFEDEIIRRTGIKKEK